MYTKPGPAMRRGGFVGFLRAGFLRVFFLCVGFLRACLGICACANKAFYTSTIPCLCILCPCLSNAVGRLRTCCCGCFEIKTTTKFTENRLGSCTPIAQISLACLPCLSKVCAAVPLDRAGLSTSKPRRNSPKIDWVHAHQSRRSRLHVCPA